MKNKHSKISVAKFDTFQEMTDSAKNWDHLCSYKLLHCAYEGEHHIIELPHIQFSYMHREGGFMHRSIAPKGSVSVAVVQVCDDKAFFDDIKLHKGDIVFFDDLKTNTFLSKGCIKATILSIPKKFMKASTLKYIDAVGHTLYDNNEILSNTCTEILEQTKDLKDTLDIQSAENTLLDILKTIIQSQIPKLPKLTKGEQIALEIFHKIKNHMDGDINIAAFAKEYQITEQTLQCSFKSLMGFTPKRFFRLLKLNHVHHELLEASAMNSSVLRIAQKWGFRHMGLFSGYYTELFGENPSVTLKITMPIVDGIEGQCVERKEEML